MNKISTKLLFGFGMFMCLLMVHAILVQMTTKQATSAQKNLTNKIAPAVTLFNEIKMSNKELFLLVSNKIADKNRGNSSNRIKQIIEVELPHYVSKIKFLKNALDATDKRSIKIDSVSANASKSIVLVQRINKILRTSKDFENANKLKKVHEILDKPFSECSTEIDHLVTDLQRKYNQELEVSFLELSQSLGNNSRFFLWTSVLFIGFGIFLTIKITRAIVIPIKTLLQSVKHIQEGNYEDRVSIKGIDEFIILGNAFNQMAGSLQKSFNQIKTKNKELEQFVYIASHDLQEPLRTITSFIDLLEKEYKYQFDETAVVYVNYISQASTRMSLLVKGLLDYSRIGVNKTLVQVDCNRMMLGIQADLAILISNNNAQIKVSTLPTIKAYKTELRLLFQNLIHNAIKFQKPNTIPVVEISAVESTSHWQFMIRDNGIGIKAKHKEKVFGMFKRLNAQKEYEGTGIGLAHCVKIVDMHKGEIWVDSVVNRGSTFYVKILKAL